MNNFSRSSKQFRFFHYLNFKAKILFHIFDNHDEEWEFDTKRFLGIGWTRDVGCANVGSHNFQYQRLDVIVCDSLDMSVSNLSKSTYLIICYNITMLENSKN